MSHRIASRTAIVLDRSEKEDIMPGKQLTHFLCLPLVNTQSRSQLQTSLEHFASIAASKYDVPAKAIRPVGTLHLTLGVMNLPTEERIAAASQFLRSLDLGTMLEPAAPSSAIPGTSSKSPVLEQAARMPTQVPTTSEVAIEPVPQTETPRPDSPSKPLVVNLMGLQSMHNPSKTSILYTSPDDPSSRLHNFCEALCYHFTSSGFLLPDKRSLLLHATIVNTLYAKGGRNRPRNSGHGKNNHGVGKLDATALLEDYGAYEWAKDIRIEKVCICQMGAKKEVVDEVVVNEEYLEVVSVALP